jgi:serine/arginine repetitive matrix protein 2
MSGASPLAPSPSPRKRLVPKKSKLGVLGSSKSSQTPRERDLSDVVRRVGANSSTRNGLDIYIDPMEDHESGDMIMVKKKKSRVALDILFDELASMATSQTPFRRSYQRTCPLMD